MKKGYVKMACNAFQSVMNKECFATVSLEPRCQYPGASERFSSTGDLYADVFSRTQNNQLGHRYLALAQARLQDCLAQWWAWEQVRYLTFLRQTFRPAATLSLSLVVRTDASPGRAESGDMAFRVIRERGVRVVQKV